MKDNADVGKEKHIDGQHRVQKPEFAGYITRWQKMGVLLALMQLEIDPEGGQRRSKQYSEVPACRVEHGTHK